MASASGVFCLFHLSQADVFVGGASHGTASSRYDERPDGGRIIDGMARVETLQAG
jgi:hypothetical protein